MGKRWITFNRPTSINRLVRKWLNKLIWSRNNQPLVDFPESGKDHGARKLRSIWERTLTPIVESMSWMSPATITWLALL